MKWILIFWLSSPYTPNAVPVVHPEGFVTPEACLAAGAEEALRKAAIADFVGYKVEEFSCSIGGK